MARGSQKFWPSGGFTKGGSGLFCADDTDGIFHLCYPTYRGGFMGT